MADDIAKYSSVRKVDLRKPMCRMQLSGYLSSTADVLSIACLQHAALGSDQEGGAKAVALPNLAKTADTTERL